MSSFYAEQPVNTKEFIKEQNAPLRRRPLQKSPQSQALDKRQEER